MDNLEKIEQEENLPPQSSLKRKYVFIAVIITVIVSTGILLLLIQKEAPSQVSEVISSDAITQDETADWQTYRNEEFGFEVDYPLDLSQLLEDPVKISKDNIFTARVTKEPNPNITGPNSVDQGFFIRVFEKDNRTLESFFDDHSNLFFPLSNGSLISLTRDKDSLVTVLNKDQRTIAEANMVGLFDGDSIIVAVYSFDRLNDTTFNQILSTFRFIEPIDTSNENIEESLKITAPQGYPEPKVYKNLFDSLLDYEFYDVNHFSGLELPVISSIKLVSEESTQKYINDSGNEDLRNRRNVLMEDFYGQKEALNSSNDYKELTLKEISSYSYLVSPRVCRGDIYGCSLIMYTTFVDDIRINISVGFDGKTTDNEMDELVSQIQIAR